MADTINIDSKGLQTNISQVGKPVTQGTPPTVDDTKVVNAHYNATQGTIIFDGKKYKLTFLNNI